MSDVPLADRISGPQTSTTSENAREDVLTAVRVLTFEIAAAAELRGRIAVAVRLLSQGADNQRVIDILEGRRPW